MQDSIEGGQTTFDPLQTGSAAPVSPSLSVITDHRAQRAVPITHPYPGGLSMAVLDHIGEGLGDGEVGRRLHRRRQTGVREIDARLDG
jgi:hypothetical protein